MLIQGLTNGTPYDVRVLANNTVGTGTASAVLADQSPAAIPGAPTSVTAVPGDTSAKVSFAPPTGTPGTITGYTVTAVPAFGTTVSKSPCTSPCTITGLTNGVTYAISVTATTGAGPGPGSAPISLTPAGRPRPPADVFPGASDGAVVVSFGAANANGSAITGYVATATPVGYNSTITLLGQLARPGFTGPQSSDVTLTSTDLGRAAAPLGSVATGVDGAFSTTVRAVRSGVFTAKATASDADGTYTASAGTPPSACG
jgi:hypothetical protein